MIDTVQTERPTTSSANDTVTVVLSELDPADGLSQLRWELRDAVLSGARTVVVDVRDVPTLSSDVVSSLLGVHRLCRVRGGRVELVGCEPGVVELLYRTGLWRVFHVRDRQGGWRR
ncbi:STAS domain-containing protein [Motilibacter aurantiacus]|uniref:STAS domain-containing protein n=1 Tax=Motilibacter aurantiacus TaxID=2714955 RepID=UPI002F2B42A0